VKASIDEVMNPAHAIKRQRAKDLGD
jgi:hypothetical protein